MGGYIQPDWTDVPVRQQSLRATFDHTWNLLDEHEKSIFQSLSVFRGAFTRQAARKVSGASPYEIRALIERSLLGNTTPGWYEVHELLRQYGREKLAQSAQGEQEVCGRHSEHYLEQLARFGNDLKNAQQAAALSSIDLEHENYRAAWNWASSQDASAQLPLVVDTLCLYYDLGLRYSDGESACRTALDGRFHDQAGADLWLLGRLLTWQSRFTRLLGQIEVASQLLDKATATIEKAKIVGDQASSVEAFLALEQGSNHFHDDRTAATNCYRHSLQIYRSL